MNMDKVGMAVCPICGKIEIPKESLESITITYPFGAGKKPSVHVICWKCGSNFDTNCEWPDALAFDLAGANVNGFSFARGDAITEEDILSFMNNFKEEVGRFLDESEL